jgi:hypothetical protein
MEQTLAILILVPTAMVLTLGVMYIAVIVLASGVAGVGSIVTAIRHRSHPAGVSHDGHPGTPALHH